MNGAPPPDLQAPALAFAGRVVAGGLIGDPFVNGEPRFKEAPILLEPGRLSALYAAAEAVARVHDEAALLVAREPSLLDDFFELTPCQKLLWQLSAPSWHGFARADVFETQDPGAPLAVCELNSDTPTGQAEATVLGALARSTHPELFESGARDVNEGLAGAMLDMAESYGTARLGEGFERTLGIVFPTDLTEDLPLVRLYGAWFETRGYRVVHGSPYNLQRAPDGRAQLFGAPCSLILRHYKTDWWGERVPVWTDDGPFHDPLPLSRPLEILARAEIERRSAVINPFGAVLSQNKRMLAFLWERQDLLCEEAQALVRRYIPETLRLESLHPAELSVEREDWVLKSDYGSEGDEVVLGAELSRDEWDQALALAVPGHWVAQRRFSPRVDASGESVNFGVYVIAGRASGLYARTHQGATDRTARSVACLALS